MDRVFLFDRLLGSVKTAKEACAREVGRGRGIGVTAVDQSGKERSPPKKSVFRRPMPLSTVIRKSISPRGRDMVAAISGLVASTLG